MSCKSEKQMENQVKYLWTQAYTLATENWQCHGQDKD